MIRLPDDSSETYFREVQAILAQGGVMLEITKITNDRVTAAIGQWTEADYPFTDRELATWALAIFTPLGYVVEVEDLL